jgi:hypothetical protein
MLHISIQAQEVSPKAKVHELGLAIPHLNSSRGGLIYRVGNADALWRFGLYGLNNYQSEDTGSSFVFTSPSNSSRKGVNVGVRAGREYRKGLSPRVDLRYGAELLYEYTAQSSDQESTRTSAVAGEPGRVIFAETESTRHSPRLGFIVGMNFNILDELVIGIELNPGISYTRTLRSSRSIDGTIDNQLESTSDEIGYGLYENGTLLSLAYRF